MEGPRSQQMEKASSCNWRKSNDIASSNKYNVVNRLKEQFIPQTFPIVRTLFLHNRSLTEASIQIDCPSLGQMFFHMPPYLTTRKKGRRGGGEAQTTGASYSWIGFDTRGKFGTRIISHWNNLPRKLVESPALGTVKNQLEQVLGHPV